MKRMLCVLGIGMLAHGLMIMGCKPNPTSVAVPNVVGTTQAEARTIISGAGLITGAITEEYSSSVAVGVVISQSPRAGVSVSPGSAVALTVSKGPEETPTAIIRGDIVVPEREEELTVTSVNDNSVVFHNNAPGCPIAAGQILVSGVGNGYLRRVLSVAQTGGTVTAMTEQAELTDVFEQADVNLSTTFTADDFAKTGSPLEKAGSTFIGIENVRVQENGDITVNYDGGVSFAPAVDVKMRIKRGSVDYFKFAGTGQLHVDFDVILAASHSASVSYERSLFALLGKSKPSKLVCVYIQAGPIPIPVVVLVEFDILVGGQVFGTGSGSLTTGFDSTTTVQVGAEYANATWNNLSGISLASNLHQPTWAASSEFDGRFFLKPKLTAKLYGVTGPFIAAKPYVNFNVQPNPAPLHASMNVGIDGDLGFNILDLSVFDDGFVIGYTHSFMGPSYPLWSYSASQPRLSVLPVRRETGPGSGSTSFTVSNTGTGSMNWTVAVTAGNWLNATKGDDDTISVTYETNPGLTTRTGLITVTAPGAVDSPQTVSVVQASSAPPQTVFVPAVTGLTEDVASEAITTLGLTNTTTRQCSDTVEAGIVMSQLPLANAQVEVNSSVELTVSSGACTGSDETVMLSGNVPLEMVWIPGGTFLMGSPETEQDRYSSEGPQHYVTVAGFWMGKYELTKRQWTAVMGTTPWAGQSYVLDNLDSPAVYVSWNDAQSFLTTLNSYAKKTFRLSSEAQWEYACRASTTTRFYWGDDPDHTEIGDHAWYYFNAFSLPGQQYAHAVGQKLPNAFGLYDMSGNVLEWCQDWYHSSYVGAPTDGSAWEVTAEFYRVLRGGDFYDGDGACRSAYRNYNLPPGFGGYNYGFRIARTP